MELSLCSAGSMKLLCDVRATQSRGHRLADIGREGRILDVVAGRDQVLDLVVEEAEVASCRARRGGTTARRRRCRTSAGVSARAASSPRSEQQAAQEEQQRVAPVRRIRPVAHRLDVQMRLHHAADQLEHLVGDVGGAIGDDDARDRAQSRWRWRRWSGRRRTRAARRGPCCRRRLHPHDRMAFEAGDVGGFPGGVAERRSATSASR